MEKKRMGFWLLALVLALLWPAVLWAQVGEKYTLEFEGRYWNPKLDATLKVVSNGIGTEVKGVEDLGLQERRDAFEPHLQIKFLRKHKFNLSYLPLKWDADKFISRAIEFNGQIYSAGTQVKSRLDLKLFKVGYEYDFLAAERGFLGGTFDVMVVDFDAELKAPAMSVDQRESKTIPIPLIGLVGRIYPIKWVNLNAKISGLPLGGYGYIFDAEAGVTINPVKYVGIFAGYRYFDTKAKYTDNLLNIKLDGPFVALQVRF